MAEDLRGTGNREPGTGGTRRFSRSPFPVPLLVLLLLLPASVRAQDSVIVIDPDQPAADSTALGIPPAILDELLATWNDSATVRLPGGLVLPAGARLGGPVASYRGTLRIGGTVEGPLTVINGDLVIERGGQVIGDALVAGGRMTVDEGGSFTGEARVFWDAVPVTRQSDGSLAARERRRQLGEFATAEKTFQTGQVRTTLRLTTSQTYNRIEGLGIVFGPAFDWRAAHNLTASLDLRAILRTAPDASPFRRDLGWIVRTDWRFNGARGWGLGARTYSVISGIEEHTLPRDEIGWNAFLLQRDNRDYFSSEGVGGSAFVYLNPRLRLDASLRYEKQGSVRANDPWSLFRNDASWRPNPLVDDGHYTILGASAEFDSRNALSRASSGWWLRGSVEHSSSGDIAPASLPSTVRRPLPTQDYGFNRFTLDLRRYNRLSPDFQLNLRLWAGGWLSGDPLPLQRRLSLGGLDLLPGYPFRSLSCAPAGFSDPAQAALCDRALVTQAELRSRLRLRIGYAVRDPDHRELDRFIGLEDPDLVAFADAGSAWLAGAGPGRVPSDRIRSISEWKADAGVGIDAGGVAVYVVKALTDGEPLRVFVRLQRRF